MAPTNWKPSKPFDLRERLFEFGLLTIRVVQFLHTRGPIGVAVRAAGILTPAQDPVIKESDELVKILAAVVRNAKREEE